MTKLPDKPFIEYKWVLPEEKYYENLLFTEDVDFPNVWCYTSSKTQDYKYLMSKSTYDAVIGNTISGYKVVMIENIPDVSQIINILKEMKNLYKSEENT